MNKIVNYDYICGIKVSMFPTSFYKDNSINLLLGKGIKFNIGDKLNLNTLCYKYKKNCMIVDYKRKEEGFFGVIVENEIVKEYKEIEENDFGLIEAIYLPTGEELNIEYIQEFNGFLENEVKLKKIIEELKEKQVKLMIELQEKSIEDDFYFIKHKYKLDEVDKDIVDVNNEFNEAWIIDNTPENILLFGAYLSCLVEETTASLKDIQALEILSKKKNIKSKLERTINDNEQKLAFIKDVFSEFLYTQDKLNLQYLEWLDLKESIKEDETRDIIENIIQNIHYHIES